MKMSKEGHLDVFLLIRLKDDKNGNRRTTVVYFRA